MTSRYYPATVLALAFLVLVQSCAGTSPRADRPLTFERSETLKAGLTTREQVLNQFGDPTTRVRLGDQGLESWLYCSQVPCQIGDLTVLSDTKGTVRSVTWNFSQRNEKKTVGELKLRYPAAGFEPKKSVTNHGCYIDRSESYVSQDGLVRLGINSKTGLVESITRDDSPVSVLSSLSTPFRISVIPQRETASSR